MKNAANIFVPKTLSKLQKRNIYELMVKARVLEERLIKVYRTGDAFFWIGGPGEEAFSVPLGLAVNKGKGPQYDYLHLHYRATPTLVAMGMEMKDALRLMMNRVTDPCTGGRNFCNHYCFPDWNVVPVGSPIESQYSFAIGTALVQERWRREGRKSGISIVTGGDAGTAEGDFASCLIWASRPVRPLPIFITVQNNEWGISTDFASQHGEERIADRGKAFGISSDCIDGNDPIESYKSINSALNTIRQTGKPVIVEYRVSRLYGHSSASGANRTEDECPIERFEEILLKDGVLKLKDIKSLRTEFEKESLRAAEEVRKEAHPHGDSIWDHCFSDRESANWREF